LQNKRLFRLPAISLAFALALNLVNVSSAGAAVPVLSQGVIQTWPKFDSVTFILGNLFCTPEGSGSCTGGGPAAYVSNDEGSRVTDIVWQYSVNNGAWQEVIHPCNTTVLFSTDTWCNSNWFFDNFTVGNLVAGDVVKGRASLKNPEGNSEWMLSVGNTGTYAVDTVRTDVATARITSDVPFDSVVTGQSVTLSASTSGSSSGYLSKYEWDLNNDGVFEETSPDVATTITKFDAAGTYPVSARVTSLWGQVDEEKVNLIVYKNPSSGEPGVSINDGLPFTNSKSVTLDIVWPKFATELRISNDGGFASSRTITKSLDSKVSWELDDSIYGLYTKNVYLRFSGSKIDATKTYMDDIVLDTTAPKLNSASSAKGSGAVDASMVSGISRLVDSDIRLAKKAKTPTKIVRIKTKAKDERSGLGKVQVALSASGKSAVSVNYKTQVKIIVPKSAKKVWVRVADGAGNWSKWKVLKTK
jgi:hypothetical protein